MKTPTVNDKAIMKDLLAAVKEAGSQRQLALKMGITVAYLNDCIHRRRAIAETISDYLGYDRIVIHTVQYKKR